jgi:hypothetical protein
MVNKALKRIYNKTLINPKLLREESIITILEGRSKEEEVFNKDSTKDKPLSSIEQH